MHSKHLFERNSTLFNIIPKYLAYFLAYFRTFSYLCIMKQNNNNTIRTIGRTELAALYFPYIQPHTAWQKLRGLLAEDPELAPLTKLKRRTFLPVEVNKIYHSLGQP